MKRPQQANGATYSGRCRDLFRAISTTGSIRKLSPEPVEDETIATILEFATKAPSSQDTQPWEFLVIRDPARKLALRKLVMKGYRCYLRLRRDSLPKTLDRELHDAYSRLENVPVVILLCLNLRRARNRLKTGRDLNRWRRVVRVAELGSIFPAMQNMLLAARGLALGAWISVFHLFVQREVRDLLHLPNYVEPIVMVGIGHPRREFYNVKRRPAAEFTHHETW